MKEKYFINEYLDKLDIKDTETEGVTIIDDSELYELMEE
jgi:hypothetical protein